MCFYLSGLLVSSKHPISPSYTKALDSIKSLRKERVADQKAEKERLESLSKEKTHADKLLKRITDINASITAKQAEYEEIKKEYDNVCVANRKFHDQASHFREIYIKQEQLTIRKNELLQELEDMKVDLKEMQGLSTLILPYKLHGWWLINWRHGWGTQFTTGEFREPHPDI